MVVPRSPKAALPEEVEVAVDYYEGDPEVLLPERKKKLAVATTRRKEVNRQVDLMETRVGGVSF